MNVGNDRERADTQILQKVSQIFVDDLSIGLWAIMVCLPFMQLPI